jgi:hypothetical protein
MFWHQTLVWLDSWAQQQSSQLAILQVSSLRTCQLAVTANCQVFQ